ncbi:Kinesin light chain 3 [Rhizophlyctis rosea]|nr:Kinesin light chain 3 [Rhizophlyctis rosea]
MVGLEQKISDIFIWFDIFTLPQHGRSVIPADCLRTTFMTAIAKIGSVLMVLTAWDGPITLTRAWCVFELYAAAHMKANFHVALPPEQRPAFSSALRNNYRVVSGMLASVKSENSTATKAEDQQAIQKAIRDTVGFFSLDRTIFNLLSAWMVNVLHSYLQRSQAEEADEVEHAKWQDCLGNLYLDQGRYDLALPLLLDCWHTVRQRLGEDDPNTLASMSNLATSYKYQGEYDKKI